MPGVPAQDRALRRSQGYQAMNNLSSLPFVAGGKALILTPGFKRHLFHRAFLFAFFATKQQREHLKPTLLTPSCCFLISLLVTNRSIFLNSSLSSPPPPQTHFLRRTGLLLQFSKIFSLSATTIMESLVFLNNMIILHIAASNYTRYKPEIEIYLFSLNRTAHIEKIIFNHCFLKA